MKHNQNRLKFAQTSVEFIVLLFVAILVVSVIAFSYIDIPSLSNAQQNQMSKQYYARLPVGILGITQNDTHLQMTLINSFSEPILFQNITINMQEIVINQQLKPSEQALISFTFTEKFQTVNSYWYTLEFTNKTIQYIPRFEYPIS